MGRSQHLLWTLPYWIVVHRHPNWWTSTYPMRKWKNCPTLKLVEDAPPISQLCCIEIWPALSVFKLIRTMIQSTYSHTCTICIKNRLLQKKSTLPTLCANHDQKKNSRDWTLFPESVHSHCQNVVLFHCYLFQKCFSLFCFGRVNFHVHADYQYWSSV